MSQDNNEARTTPFGLWRYGNDFRLAAQDVLERDHGKYFMPYYFLVGQSVELLLKAFLRAKGVTVKELRSRTYGHDLDALITESRRRRIGTLVKLTSVHVAGIKVLNLTYREKRLQYIQTGMMLIPEVGIVQEASEQLANGLKNYCLKATG